MRDLPLNAASTSDFAGELSGAFYWREQAREDYRICRIFAEMHGARVDRSAGCQRLAWPDGSGAGFGVVLPDLVPPKDLKNNDWYIYNVDMDLLMRVNRLARERAAIVLLPDGVDGWVSLLRSAVRKSVFDLAYSVAPIYLDAFGEMELEATAYSVTVRAHGPDDAVLSTFEIEALGDSPDFAARECCRKWLKRDAARNL